MQEEGLLLNVAHEHLPPRATRELKEVKGALDEFVADVTQRRPSPWRFRASAMSSKQLFESRLPNATLAFTSASA